MKFLSTLNDRQKQAVTAGTGPTLVLAGPGSGKTRVLTQRIAYLISMMGVRPYHILAVTFTNKASREMESRVAGLIEKQLRGLTLGTFHGVCARILRREADKLPFSSGFVIFDSSDQLSLIKRSLKDLNIDKKRYRPHSIHASISRVKNELTLPEDLPIQNYRDQVVQRVYERYQNSLLASNALDFDDLLLWAVRLFENHPEVQQKYARRYEHVLVDEFQDTNMAQYQLLKHLTSFHRNIFVVGDTDQSIYRWRGADYRNISRFENDFPDYQVVLLEQNYRSTQVILDAAMAVIEPNPNRKPKRLFTDRGAGQKIVFHETYDDREEAQYVVDSIAALIATNGVEPGDFAIMYRTNAQSRLLEEAFLRANLPYKLVGAQRFYGRREIKDIIAYLRLVHNPADDVSLLRVINVPPRRIGRKTLEVLRTQAAHADVSPGELLLDLSQKESSIYYHRFPGRSVVPLATFGALLAEWRSAYTQLSPLQLMDRILEDVDYHTYIDDGTEEGVSRWENVLELRRLAAEYQDRTLVDFLEEIALVSDQDTLEESANAPTLLTLHAAKGLEFPIVFIVGLEDGTLPHIRSFDDPEAMAEERRLLYVGITRARDRLYLVSALNRSAYGYAEPTEPSRFLEHIPLELLNGSGVTQNRKREEKLTEGIQWETSSSTYETHKRYAAGMRVRHPVWGDGMVLNSRIQDGDETVDIFFENLGLKKVVASLAKLETVGD